MREARNKLREARSSSVASGEKQNLNREWREPDLNLAVTFPGMSRRTQCCQFANDRWHRTKPGQHCHCAPEAPPSAITLAQTDPSTMWVDAGNAGN